MRASLQDIADRLGLSRSTISRALRHDPCIPLATRQKIQAIAKELDYRPNSLMSEIASSHWRAAKGSVIAYIDGIRPGDRNNAGLIAAMTQRALSLGYRLEMFRRVDFASSAKLQRVLRNRGITDLIIGQVFEEELTTQLDWSKFISVQLLPGLFPLPLHSVVKNHFNAVVLAWQKAVERGYQRIGAILVRHPGHLNDDLLRAGAVDVCQKQLFPHLEAISPLYYEFPKTRMSDFGRWVRARKPDVLIAFSVGHYFFYRSEFRREIPYICLHNCDPMTFSGIPEAAVRCAMESVHLLQLCRKTHQWGLPEQRMDYVMQPQWFEGNSLPMKRAR